MRSECIAFTIVLTIAVDHAAAQNTTSSRPPSKSISQAEQQKLIGNCFFEPQEY